MAVEIRDEVMVHVFLHWYVDRSSPRHMDYHGQQKVEERPQHRPNRMIL